MTAPSPTSRRRAGKSLLTQDAIVAASLRVLETEGMDALSLRRVASELDTGPASLYAHVANLDALLALVFDAVLAEVDTAPPGHHWQARLTHVIESYVDVMGRHSGVALLAMNTVSRGPNSWRMVDCLLGLLNEAGLDSKTAAWGMDLIMMFISATALEHSNRQRPGHDPFDAVEHALAHLPGEQYPHVHGARDVLMSGGAERFVWGLEVLLAGIRASPVR